MKEQLINILSQAGSNFTSGQELADLLACSRTAVWKHIEQLRNDGYEIEAVRKKGYRIVAIPDKVSPKEISVGLETESFAREIYYEEVLHSTQKVALQLAAEGAKEGTIVICEQQTEGRGRLDRKWASSVSKSVLLTIILRPKIPIGKTPQLTLLTAVALVESLKEVTNLDFHIKWPNDILINNKKVAGILTQLQAEADQVNSVIIGVGINVNETSEDFPPELSKIATSLAIEGKRNIVRTKVVQTFLLKLEQLYKLYLENGFQPIKKLWESNAITIGKMITATTVSETIRGKALGITDDGILQVQDEKAVIHKIYSADIS